jgi:hypothetical protein
MPSIQVARAEMESEEGGTALISHEVFLKSLKTSQFPQKSVILLFISVIGKDKSTNLKGS